MKKNVPYEMSMDQIAQVLNEVLKPVIGSNTGTKPRIPEPEPVVVVAIASVHPQDHECADLDFRDILCTLQEEAGEDGYDEESFDCGDLDEQEDCPDYDPVSEDNDRCLFLCPCCGTCMKKHLEEAV